MTLHHALTSVVKNWWHEDALLNFLRYVKLRFFCYFKGHIILLCLCLSKFLHVNVHLFMLGVSILHNISLQFFGDSGRRCRVQSGQRRHRIRHRFPVELGPCTAAGPIKPGTCCRWMLKKKNMDWLRPPALEFFFAIKLLFYMLSMR